MFKEDFIIDGYDPLFALVEDSHLDAVTSQIQLYFFEKRTNINNIKTQILKSDDDVFLLVLYIKNTNDDESLQFILDNMTEPEKIIDAKKIKSKSK